MANGITYTPDYSALRRIGVSGPLRVYLTTLAAAGVAEGKRASPVGRGEPGPAGRYRDGFRITQETETTRRGDRRAAVRITNETPHGWWVEYGGRGVPAYGIMRGPVLAGVEAAHRG